MSSKFNAVIVMGLLLKFVTMLNAIRYEQPNRSVYKMGINDTKQCCSTDEKKSPPIYCYLGKDEWDTNNIFQTVTVNFIIEGEITDDVIMYDGKDECTVEMYMSDPLHVNLSWNIRVLMFYLWGQKGFNLNPFQPSCFGFKTDHNFEIKIHSDEFDLEKMVIFLFGISLFGYSDRLSRNPVFQYLFGAIIDIIKLHYSLIYYCGVITTSIITFMYYFVCKMSRLVKILILGLFLLILVKNLLSPISVSKFLNLIVSTPYTIIMSDAFFVLFLYLFILWRCCNYKPVTDPNSIELIAWTLKILGLVLIPLSTYFLKTALFLDVLLCFIYYDYTHESILRLPTVLGQYFMPSYGRRRNHQQRR